VVHQPVARGFAVFADAWLSDWLAEISADLRENGSALDVVLHDYALYKSTFTLLYSEEGPGRAAAPPSLLLAVPNVTAHPSTASAPTLYCSMWHYNCLSTLKG